MALFSIDTDYCLNYNYKSTDCRRCRDTCPQECWNENGFMDASRCDSCGLCLAACPADAIAVEGFSHQAWQELTMDATASVLKLGCQKFHDGLWACLGFLTARDMVALSWKQHELPPQELQIFCSRCDDCRPAVARHLRDQMRQANEFLGKLGGERISVAREDSAKLLSAKTVDRRKFFQSLLASGMTAARNIIWPESSLARLPRNEWRAERLRGRMHQQLSSKQLLFSGLSASERCVACGLCAKICPSSAIEETETPHSLALFFEPLACSGCGLCIEHCPEDCLQFVAEGPAQGYFLISKDYPKCVECGQSFRPAGKQESCMDCLLKGRREIFGPAEDEKI